MVCVKKIYIYIQTGNNSTLEILNLFSLYLIRIMYYYKLYIVI